MTNDILDLLQGDWLPVESVSGGDAFVGNDLLGMESVSGGDASGGVFNYYQINLYALPEDSASDLEIAPDSESQEMQYTLWGKPLEEYSVSEGLLLILVVIAVMITVWCTVKGGFKWHK